MMTAPSPKHLSELMVIEALEGKTADEVEMIWNEYHDKEPHRVASVMSSSEWTRLSSNAKSSPLFVLPLKKPGGGYLSMLSQAQVPLILLTTVDEYRTQTVNAPAHLSITAYDELKESNGIVLLRGDIINEHTISKTEGRLLMELIRAFYSVEEDYRAPSGPYAFNHTPTSFSFTDLLAKLKIEGGMTQ